MKRKLLAFLLVAVLVVGIVPTTVFADDVQPGSQTEIANNQETQTPNEEVNTTENNNTENSEKLDPENEEEALNELTKVILDPNGGKPAKEIMFDAMYGCYMRALTLEELPVSTDGYSFMGYYDKKTGTKYYDCNGNCVNVLDIQGSEVRLSAMYAVPVAVLYDSGKLVFQRGYELDSKYGNPVATFPVDENKKYNVPEEIPWLAVETEINGVIFRDSISPVSTAFWFYGMNKLSFIYFAGLDTSKLQKMTAMFYGCESLTEIDLWKFNTSNVVSADDIFYGCKNLKTIELGTGWNFNGATMERIFNFPEVPTSEGYSGLWANVATGKTYDNKSIPSNTAAIYTWAGNETIITLDPGKGTAGKETNVNAIVGCAMPTLTKEHFPTAPESTSFAGYFDDETGTKYYNADGTSAKVWDIAKGEVTLVAHYDVPTAIIYENGMMVFQLGDEEEKYYGKVLGKYTGFDTAVYGKSTEIPWYADKNHLNVSYITFRDRIAVTSTARWFGSFKNLISCNLAGLDTSNVTNMSYMFYGCNKLENVDLSTFDTHNVESATSFMGGCSALQYITVGPGWYSWGKNLPDGTAVLRIPNAPKGETYSGYWTNETGTVQAINDDKLGTAVIPLVLEETTLTWAKQKTVITLDPHAEYTSPVLVAMGDEMPTLNKKDLPIKEGYNFRGYFDEKNNKQYYNADGTGTTTWDKTDKEYTLVARWSAKTVTAAFDCNGGEYKSKATSMDIDQIYDKTYILPSENPTRYGYLFNVWSTAKTSGTTVTAETTVKNAKNHSIYALWTATSPSVTFDANGGAFSDKKTTDTKLQTFDSNFVLPTSNPTRDGYTFAGWFTEATGGTEVTASTKVTKAGDYSVYAHWTANTNTPYCIHMRLLHQGIIMNIKKICRLMEKYGLFCPIRKANPY